MRLHRPLASILVLFCTFIASTAHAGGAITSGSTVAGVLAGPSYLESWTFSGTNGQRVLIAAVTTTGAVNTNIVLKQPGGTIVVNTSNDVTEYQLLATGAFTIEITDVGLNDAGNYSIAFTNLTAGPWNHATDLDGGAIVSADVKTGTMSGAADIDCFTFSGTNGQRVIMDAVTTAGSLNTTILLYAPAGGTWLTYTFADRLEAQLNATGTWIIAIYDNGNDTAGSYSLSFLNVTGGPLENGSDTDGEAILSNDIKTGQFQQGVDFDAFTFAGTAGHRVLCTALATGAGTHNPNISIYPPGGGNAETSTSNDIVELQLAQTGTYTIVVEDAGNDNAGTYAISMMNVTAGPYTNGSDLDGGAIVSADVKTGTMSGVGDIDCFTFSGTNGQRVIMDAVTTAGSLNTTILLYAPAGGTWLTYTFADRLEAQLNATGTWSIVVYDNGYDTAGSYSLSFLNVTGGPLENGSDTDGEAIASNDIKTGQFQQGVDFDAFTFTGTAGHRVMFMGVATGAGSHNPNLSIYPPGGGNAETSSSNDNFDLQLAQTGTYTIVVEDAGNEDAGTYTISMMNLTAGPYTNGSDLDGGAIVSADVKTGTMSGAADMDCFTFSGTSGQRVVMDAVTTAGSLNTTILLYPPGGGNWLTYTFADRLEAQLTATGTWTIVLYDNGYDTPGSYSMSFLNVTGGPLENGSDTDGDVIASNDIKTGQFQQGVDFDAFTFTGTAGHRIMFMGVATGAGSHNPNLSIYPPGGGNAETSTSNDNFDLQLLQTGTYTIVVEDAGNDNAGTYTISMMNLTAGPYTNGSDLDGGTIVSADVKTGSMSGVADMDCFTFSGTSGQRVLMDAVTTAGSLNTTILLYAPAGGTWLTYTFADRLEAQLNATGTWTIVIYDNGYDTPGSYSMSFLNVTGGPLENGSDTDGETILSNDIKTGQFQQGVDFDAFTFTGLANRRYAFVGLATGGGGHNPQLSVYPPGGGAALTSTSSDRFDVLVPSAGTYTLVVEDTGNDNAGTYLISMLNITGGTFSNGSDPDGGAIASNDIRTGTTTGPGDLDGYQFPGFNGNRVLITAQSTGGAGYDPMIYLYPPGGGTWATYTFADRLEFQLTSSGTWTILVEDNGNDVGGNYTLSMLNATNGPYTTGAETDGGPMVEGVPENGSAISVGDYDGFTFYALTGQTAQLTATKTSGAMDTYISLYPPGGGSAVTATSNDNIAPVLTASGYYTVVIEDVGQNETGNYTLSLNLNGGPTDVGDGPPPAELALLPATPSPFSQTTRLGFELPSASRVHLRVYDVRGARVRYLVDDRWEAGAHSVTWDGRDDRGARVASGVYYLHLEAGGHVRRQKVVLVK